MTSKMSLLVCWSIVSTIVLGLLCGVHGSSFYKQQSTLTTIKTGEGQVYDCVDFYKQPAFNHPSLNNHIPTVNITSLQRKARKLENLGLKDGCPIGTVPILRLSNVNKSLSMDSTLNGRHCNAGFRVDAKQGLKLLGAHGTTGLWKPLVYGNEWSVSRMKILNGPDSIEAGWMVNPNLYNDLEAHLYARWTAGSSGCFNLLCSGFVQVSTNVPLGIIPHDYSHIGWDNQTGWIISIDKNLNDGNWWLTIDADKKQVGYWPKSLFTSLSESGSRVEWGGEIDNPDSNTPPYMGSGQKAMKDTRQSALYCQIGVFADQKGQVPAELYTDCDEYTSIDAGYQGDFWGRLIFYGGPYKKIG
ncbi:uncharacterized protein [Spinacia oleracea]|uniref:Neprosin PEP catalytic domain-containing protein n=1 Tax=Spinacia oleracea TaxID=3562 RepID=A0ABM3QIP0_SPIOL|nr:uncharacterized protein LOC130459728 [Spinacia oleracea]